MDAELHTPALNAIGLPSGKLEYDIRRDIRDLAKLYGAKTAKQIVTDILDEEVPHGQEA